VESIFGLLDEYTNTVNQINISAVDYLKSPDVDHARRNLRKHYLGKSIIQPMDGVHVYIRSNTLRSSDITGPISSQINGSSFIRAFRDDQTASDAFLQEEMRQFGLSDMHLPLDLYRQLRTGSFMRNAGMHVFGGLISRVEERYSADKGYVLDVAGESNMKWLKMSRVNVSPSLTQTQGLLEDPLTPFQIETDPGTGLVVSQPALLQENIQRKLQFNSGQNAGKVVDDTNVRQDIQELTGAQVVQHAPGMVYRWKEGIITATQNVNLITALDGSGIKSRKLSREVGRTVVETPFASMDAADIISILVTGFPHSYEKFLNHTKDAGTYTAGSGTNSPESFFESTFDILRTQNRALGNFQPFKTTNVTPQMMSARIGAQVHINETSQEINSLRSQLAQVQDQLASLTAPSVISNDDPFSLRREIVKAGLKHDGYVLESKLTAKLGEFRNNVSTGTHAGLRVYGSDYNVVVEGTDSTDQTADNIRKQRIKNEALQMRTQLKCKLNEDTNFFIVSDEYDKDLDIQAFVLNLANKPIDMWKSEYKEPIDTCEAVASTLDWEFFCDSQGHIEFRPPKYNKVPLSLGQLKERQRILKRQIQIQAILLGADPTKIVDESATLVGTGSGNGLVSIESLRTVNAASAAEAVVFGPSNVIKYRNEVVSIAGGNVPGGSEGEKLEKVVKEIESLNDSKNPNMNTARLNEINKLAQFISQLQQTNTLLTKINGQQTKYGQTQVSDVRKIIRTNDQDSVLAIFADLVEDDYNDLLGPGSARRYIITDDQILNSTFTESDRDIYTHVDVTGELKLIAEGPSMVAGMPLIWAGATDFDLWRQYGWKAQSFNKPFFDNAESQCAPYAQMLLSRYRKNAVTGTVTLAGNEYYQLGDVVYFNSRSMLYYVTQVNHQFSYSSNNFTTTLELKMGHPLGEYIPTPLDVIGKTMIKNNNSFNKMVTYRNAYNKFTPILLGTVAFPDFSVETSAPKTFIEMLSGGLGKVNTIQLKNALLRAGNIMASYGKFTIEIRGYMSDDRDKTLVLSRMQAVKDWFATPSTATDDKISVLHSDYFKAIDPSKVIINTGVYPLNITKSVEDESKQNRENAINGPTQDIKVLSSGANDIRDFVEFLLIQGN
jgi:hypothetical protein